MLEEEIIGQRRFSDRVCISDPCYDRGTWCGEFDLDIKEGSYECRTIVGEWANWGRRVWRLTAVHENEKVTKWKFETNLGVDAAMMSIICSVYYDTERHEALSDYRSNAGQTGHGFYSNSGLGDGSYALFCGHNDKNEIVALSVVFLYPDGVEESVADEDGMYSFSNEETVEILSKYAHCSVEQYVPTKTKQA
tara:strand:+ start:2981 stop:3559 length:579 start_codon:yes stop_codon:yes gene_type:complete